MRHKPEAPAKVRQRFSFAGASGLYGQDRGQYRQSAGVAPELVPVQLTGFLHGFASALRRWLSRRRLGLLAARWTTVGRFIGGHINLLSQRGNLTVRCPAWLRLAPAS